MTNVYFLDEAKPVIKRKFLKINSPVYWQDDTETPGTTQVLINSFNQFFECKRTTVTGLIDCIAGALPLFFIKRGVRNNKIIHYR